MPLNDGQVKTLIVLQAMTFGHALAVSGMQHDHLSAAALRVLAFTIEKVADAKVNGKNQTIMELAQEQREALDLEVDFVFADFKDRIKIP